MSGQYISRAAFRVFAGWSGDTPGFLDGSKVGAGYVVSGLDCVRIQVCTYLNTVQMSDFWILVADEIDQLIKYIH